MAYDPTLPAENTLISSAELRSQLQGLKDEIDERATTAALNDVFTNLDTAIQFKVDITTFEDRIVNDTAGTCSGSNTLGLTISNPPTQAEVEAILDKLNEIISALRRE